MIQHGAPTCEYHYEVVDAIALSEELLPRDRRPDLTVLSEKAHLRISQVWRQEGVSLQIRSDPVGRTVVGLIHERPSCRTRQATRLVSGRRVRQTTTSCPSSVSAAIARYLASASRRAR